MSSRFFSSLPALVLGFTLSACLQANGETCQLGTDCESGVCCKGRITGVEERGVCSAADRCADEPEPDAGSDAGTDEADAATEDAGPEDDAAIEDAGTDASAPDASTTDASTPDSSIPDAATDAGTDAGDAV